MDHYVKDIVQDSCSECTFSQILGFLDQQCIQKEVLDHFDSWYLERQLRKKETEIIYFVSHGQMC